MNNNTKIIILIITLILFGFGYYLNYDNDDIIDDDIIDDDINDDDINNDDVIVEVVDKDGNVIVDNDDDVIVVVDNDGEVVVDDNGGEVVVDEKPTNVYVKLIKCDGTPPNLNYVFKLDDQITDPMTGSIYNYQQLTDGRLFISIEFDPIVFGSKVTSSGYYSGLDKCEDIINNEQEDGSITKGNYTYKLEKATKEEFYKWFNGNRD